MKDEATAIAHHTEMASVMNLALSRTLRQMTAEDYAKVPASLARHMDWVKHHVNKLPLEQKDSPEAPLTDHDLERRLQVIEEIHPAWKLHTDVVRELKNILVGEKDPLEVIFNSDLADLFYADMFAQICDSRLRNFLELASHENPGLRILEVGAGTGGFTGHGLGALLSLEQETGAPRLAEYTYTDVSPMFFDRARERWKSLNGRIKFRTLNLERSLESQGFETGSYDLIVAGSVLHATADLVGTMKNVQTALKPGGKALILEVVAPEDVVVNFSFGLVPGWWLAREEWRKMSPLLNEEQWDSCLRQSGYSGNDLVLKDHEDERCHICSIIVTTATEETAASPISKPTSVLLVVDSGSEKQAELATLIHENILALGGGHDARILSLEELRSAQPTPGDVILCFANLDTPYFSELSEGKLTWLPHLLRHAKKLLWVIDSINVDNKVKSPFYSQAQGFFRSLRLEAADSQIVTLAIESQHESTAETSAQHINKILHSSFLDSTTSEEVEYVVRNGVIETCRAAEDVEGNAALEALLTPQLQHKPWSQGAALSLSVRTAGTLDSLCFVEDTARETELAPGEVEIEARAWAVNFRDVLQALGRLDERTFGADCAGFVTRVGPGSGASVRVGDRVCLVAAGCMRQFPRAPATSVIAIPSEDMSFASAAAALVPGMTAYYSLVNVARIAEGETVLIHSAAGSTGIPEDRIFHSRNTSFAQGIKRVTGGRGVDVVLNSPSGDSLRASWECVARRGRFVEIGKADILANSGLPMNGFLRNVTFSAVDLREIIGEDPDLTAELLRNTMEFVRETGTTPTPVTSFPASKVEEAFRTLQNGTNIGLRRSWKFDSNATYVVAGGSGGVGQAIIRWMADRGVKFFIVPSRSGASSKAAAAEFESLRARGVTIFAPRCNVTSESALSRVLEECSLTMPPVRGCIDAALVLQDAMFENMTLEQWNLAIRAIRTKVDTAWNLHRLLPQDLDFFVLLSSLAGVLGQMATANYAAGCAFQDALARHCVERGQKAVSLDIGWMRDVGIVAAHLLSSASVSWPETCSRFMAAILWPF
ncbi:KR domain-containing protein [Colletotrichum sojae]|uniref:KR domain-containing protein n=1 Tax=Colletotrichum sojae TaxID=2175907 RepID=A0A8H6IQ25_9PEZI|nr:KR domain-containing protein [Colletotrichum sojae]